MLHNTHYRLVQQRGQSIEWELDILRSYDDDDGLPPWINNPVTPLVGSGNPIEIDWERDYDVYKPIIGSSAKVNLLVQTAGQYADFNNANPYEYQVRLRYVDTNDVMQDYWCGFMTSLDGKEEVGTFPFPVSFTATDGLGLLEEATAEVPTSITDVNVIDAVSQALYQTGLNLDIYLDSGIQIGDGGTPVVYSEALRQVTIDPDWVYNEERTERLTLKEQIEGVLSAFNCTIKQSNGKWYITNASTYGGTTDSVTFEVYNVVTNVYVKNATDVTETIQYVIDGSETAALIPANQDLVLNTRRPNGSIECKPKDFYSEDVQNGGFEVVNDDATSSPVGWTAGPTEGPLKTSDTIRQAGERSIFTNHNTFALDTVNDTWFTNTTGIDVNGSGTFEVSFDMLAELLITEGSQGVRNAKLSYQVIFVPDNPMTVGTLSTFLPTNIFGVTALTAAAYFYNPDREEWLASSTMNTRYGFDLNVIEAEGDDVGEWIRASVTMPKVRIWDYTLNDFGETTVGPGKLFVRFYFPRGNRPVGNGKSRNRGNGNDRMNVYVDNVSAKNMFSNDVTEPTFERVQDNYTSTYTYEPGIASSTSPALVQTINQTEFIRTGNGIDIITNKSLEEIGTQLKLNDFRNNFKYYEGSLVNLTAVPLAPHHKVYVNWANYTETASCIINGGRFNVKGNQFDIAMYVPDQSSDVTSEYFTEDVDLIPMPFPGRSNKRVYSLNVVVSTTGDGGAVVNGLVPVQQSYQWTASPGDEIPIEIALEPLSPNRAVSSATVTAPDSTDTPLVQHITNINYSNNGIQLRVSGTLIMPEDSEFETLYINATITDATPENLPDQVDASVTIHIHPTFTGISTAANDPVYPYVINLKGIPGDRKPVVHTIKAADGLFVENVDETHADGSLKPTTAIITGNGTQAATLVWDYDVAEENVDVTVTGSTRPATGIGVNPITKTLTITNSVPSLTVVDGLSIPFVGIVGQKIHRNITCEPPLDQYIDSLATSSVSGDIVVGTPYVSGEDWEIPVEVEIVDDNVQPSFTIGGELKEEPYSVTFSIKAVGLDNAKVYVVDGDGNRVLEHRETFDEGNFVPGNDDITPFIIVVEPTGNNVFTDITDIITTINEGAVVVNGNEIVDLGEDAFTASPTLNTSTGVINVTIQGKFPTKGGQYVLATAIIGDTNAQGGIGVTETRASFLGTTITTLTPGEPISPGSNLIAAGIGAAGGTAQFRLIADGTWELQDIEVTLSGSTTTSTTGSFTETVSTNDPLIQPPLSFTQSGSIGPLSGGAGEHIITLTVDALGYASRVDGSQPIIFIAEDWQTGYVFRVRGVGPQNAQGSAGAVASGVARQKGDFGTANIVLPGFTDTAVMMASMETGAENLLFFG